MKPILLFTAVIIALTSCNENRIYESHTDPSGNLEWKKDQIVEFEVEIKDNTLKYNEILALRYGQGFMYTNLPVIVTRVAPDGSEKVTEHSFNVRKEDGSRNGEPAYDIWDLEEIMHKDVVFPENGTYKYTIQHQHERDLLHYVMEIGLIVDKEVIPPR